MTSLIMTNGEYRDAGWYEARAKRYRCVICADGGANWAKRFGIVPDLVVGDMDSISGEEYSYLEKKGVEFCPFPPEKDFTDTQLAMEIAAQKGLKDITVWGGTGSRLDHTLANILCAVFFVKNGMNIRFESPSVTIYFVTESLLLPGDIGDTVSVLALGERAEGVSLTGFQYPLNEVILEANQPIGVSNIIKDPGPLIRVSSGVLAVFHNHGPLD